MRPHTLAEVASLALAGESFDRSLANFLDQFYSAPAAEALATVPDRLAPIHGQAGRVRDAYLAATAEHLACAHGFPVPAWVASDDRSLHRPWFATPLASLRALLLWESPPAFRSRNLFVSENALARA